MTVAFVAACDPTEPANEDRAGNDHDNDEERRHDHAEPGHDAYEPLIRDRGHLLSRLPASQMPPFCDLPLRLLPSGS